MSLTLFQPVRGRSPRRRWWRRRWRGLRTRWWRRLLAILRAVAHMPPREGGLRPLSTRSGLGVHFGGGGTGVGWRGGSGSGGGGIASLPTTFSRLGTPALGRVRRWNPVGRRRSWRRGLNPASRRLLRLRGLLGGRRCGHEDNYQPHWRRTGFRPKQRSPVSCSRHVLPVSRVGQQWR